MNNKRFFYVFMVAISMVAIIAPIAMIIILSFSKNYSWPSVIPNDFGLRGWNYVFENRGRVLTSLGNSIFISSMTTLITVLISIPCAKVLALDDIKGKKIIESLVFSPIIIPPVSIGMGLSVEFIRMGLARTYLGVILVSIVPCIPYAVRMLKEVFLIIGKKYIEQAYILGAGTLYTYRYVLFPMLLPGIISASMMCYIVSFSQYFLVYLIGGGRINTFTMDMFPFIQSGDRMLGAVYAIIFVLSTFFTLIVMEYILKKIYKNEMENYNYI